MKNITLILCLLFALSVATPAAFAQPTKDQLKEQFKSRDSELKDLKKRSQVGETIDGYVDAVDAGDPAISAFLAAENKDRRDCRKKKSDVPGEMQQSSRSCATVSP